MKMASCWSTTTSSLFLTHSHCLHPAPAKLPSITPATFRAPLPALSKVQSPTLSLARPHTISRQSPTLSLARPHTISRLHTAEKTHRESRSLFLEAVSLSLPLNAYKHSSYLATVSPMYTLCPHQASQLSKHCANLDLMKGIMQSTPSTARQQVRWRDLSRVSYFSSTKGVWSGINWRGSYRSVTATAKGGGPIADEKVRKDASGGQNTSVPPTGKLQRLRDFMGKADGGKGVDAFVIPSEDPHQSEYSADCFARRSYISDFTGSAGTALVTKEKALLWTDGRYFLQAEKQLSKDWTLMRGGNPGVPTYGEWLRDTLPPGSRVGIDPFLHSSESARQLADDLAQNGHTLVPLYEGNLVDSVWDEQPPPPLAPLRIHKIEFAGKDVPTKLEEVRAALRGAGATALVVPMLDEVAWLFNLRGGDVPHCPVAIAYAIVELGQASLYVDEGKATPEVAAFLQEAGVNIRPYDKLLDDMRSLAQNGAKLWMDPTRVSLAIKQAFTSACEDYYAAKETKGAKKEGKRKGGKGKKASKDDADSATSDELDGPASLSRPSPVIAAKAVKNAAELEGMRRAHLRDAAALAEFWSWLESTVVGEGRSPTEVEVGDRLEAFRARQAGFIDTSFDTIAGSGPNGAIIHYRAEDGKCATVNADNLFLLDSGGQYEDGTTDITRTAHLGTPTARQKNCFTRVLQGHIALDSAVFPEGTPGFVLDALARTALWRDGLDYRHGTGHGVGAALNVHEGPQGISPRFGNMTPLAPGMIISNEPGYYEDGSFGIRIENLLAVKESDTPNRFGGVTFLEFERLTFFPIQTSLLDLSIMGEHEITWLDDYHKQVWDKVSPLVSGDALSWLHKMTRPIERPKSSPNTIVSEALAPM